MRKSAANSILDALFPKVRQKVLTSCLLHPEKWWYLSDLAKHLGLRPSSLQAELASLVQCELLKTRRDGNRVYYSANSECPILKELQSLLIKTAGITDQIKRLLKRFDAELDFAVIFGSIARAEALSSSDVDVLLVGKIKMADLAPHLPAAESALGREINPIFYSRREFSEKLRNDHGFLRTLRRNELIYIKGSESDFEALGGSGGSN